MADAAYAALPQRAPRSRRADRDAAQQDAAAAAAAAAAAEEEQRSPRKRDRNGDALAADDPAAAGPSGEASAPGGVVVAWRDAASAVQSFEYMDHTADIQLHAWGATVEEAFGWTALCMFNYMTPLAGFEAEPLSTTREVTVTGHDMQSLLFAFLDELLFLFSTEFLVVRELQLHAIDREGWTLAVTARGSRFVPGQHEQGTEVKAITYSAMQIHEREKDAEVFVIVDI